MNCKVLNSILLINSTKKYYRYPLYQRGNPQLRVFLPNFWMKLVRPEELQPKNVVQFIVPTGMTNYDIQNYLEKIYKVKVIKVESNIENGNI